MKVGHAAVSRIHCEIYELDGALVVRDAGSLNGTFIDNVRITESVLKPGDRLTVGPLTFVAEYEHHGEFPVLPVRAPASPSTTVPDEALRRIASASASATSPGFAPPPVPVPLGVPLVASAPEVQAGDVTAPDRESPPPGEGRVEGATCDQPPAADAAPQPTPAMMANAPATIDLPPTLDLPAGYSPPEQRTPELPNASTSLPFVPPAGEASPQPVDEDDDDLQNFFQELGLK